MTRRSAPLDRRSGRSDLRGQPLPRPRRPRLCVTLTDAAGRPTAARGLARWLERVAPGKAKGTVAVALMSDRDIRRLNRDFRGVDKATDVLSFPSGHRQPATGNRMPHIGDLAIALGVARRQARERRHSLDTELKVLALHGLLHLLGYDHERDRGAMNKLEDRLRRRAGLPTGLIARTASGRPARQ